MLILEWIENGQDLYRHHATRSEASPTLAAALARVLATIHGIAPDDEELRDDAPWVLSLHRPKLDALRYLSAASIELIRTAQADARVTSGLDELRDGWRNETLVHRDVKWANCVAYDPRGGARATQIKLVDWEMAGWGDPAFDVGSAFNDFLGYCERGQRPLSSVQPAIAAFWRAYLRARALDERAAARLLVRAIRFAGARLLQSTFEHTQETPHVTGRVTAGAALGATLLSAPRRRPPTSWGSRRDRRAADRPGAGRYEAQVAAALGAIDVRPPGALLWFGRRAAARDGCGGDARSGERLVDAVAVSCWRTSSATARRGRDARDR